jgi:CPA2 family monovalent cation:H+ antiporter-2
MPHVPLLDELAIIAGVGVLVTIILSRLKLPAVAGLLVAGACVGPFGFGMVSSVHAIEVLAELGVVLLLFTIGLEFSLSRLAGIFKSVALGGMIQVGLTGAVAAGVALALGQTVAQAIFYSFVFALSSTAIVLRGLADRREMDAPHGRFIVGTLIFQDICVIPMVIIVPLLGVGASATSSPMAAVSIAMGKAIVVVTATIMLARVVVPRLLGWIDASRSREVFLLSILGMCIGSAWATSQAGLSLALGAFLGGMIIADTEYGHRAMGELVTLRDAFMSLFFVSLGMLFDVRVLVEHPLAVALLVAGFVLAKGLLATIAALAMRFPARVAWLAGVGLAQFGEFGFVLAKLGQSNGIISADDMRPLLGAGVISMFLTPLLVRLAPHLRAGEKLLSPLERLIGVRSIDEDTNPSKTWHDHVIIVGFGLAGRLTARALREANVPYLILELNAKTVADARNDGEHVFYGDATSAEALEHAHIEKARALVLVMNDPQAATRVSDVARRLAPNVPTLMRARFVLERPDLLAAGANEVIVEEVESGLRVAERTLDTLGFVGDAAEERIHALRMYAEDETTHAKLPRRI